MTDTETIKQQQEADTPPWVPQASMASRWRPKEHWFEGKPNEVAVMTGNIDAPTMSEMQKREGLKRILQMGIPDPTKAGGTFTIPRFYQLLDELRELHDRKAHDYAPGEDRFLNFRQCELIGVPAYEGAIIRMLDKVSRLTNLTKRAKAGETMAVNEPITETLKDMAVYALIIIELYEQHHERARHS